MVSTLKTLSASLPSDRGEREGKGAQDGSREEIRIEEVGMLHSGKLAAGEETCS